MSTHSLPGRCASRFASAAVLLMAWLTMIVGGTSAFARPLDNAVSHAVPQPAGSILNGVSCRAAKDCWAVGVSNGNKNEALHWNGSRWSIVSTPNRTKASQHGLNAVDCNGPANCWAVGANGSGDQILHWNGSKWSFVPSPNLADANGNPTDSALTDVTCTSSVNCWAVGWQEDKINGVLTTLNDIMQWNGWTWSLVSGPNLPASYLSGVTCKTSTNCWAVGAYCCGIEGYRLNEALHWDGLSWYAVPATSPAHEQPLSGVTCVSAKNCWAVGGAGSNEAMRWNGNKWSAVHVPNPGLGDGITGLASVACPSSTNCWAVGEYSQNAGARSPAEVVHWDGSSWARVGAPQTTVSPLSGVACTSLTNCWAVGSYNGSTNEILHWNGSKWSTA